MSETNGHSSTTPLTRPTQNRTIPTAEIRLKAKVAATSAVQPRTDIRFTNYAELPVPPKPSPAVNTQQNTNAKK